MTNHKLSSQDINQQLNKTNGESTSRSQKEQQSDERLLSISKELLPQYGVEWGIHSLVTLKRHPHQSHSACAVFVE